MRKQALLVGVEEYRDPQITPLRYARGDAEALGAELRARCGFEQVRVLASESGEDEPLLVNIVGALRDMAGELREEDLFLFFFAGHGIEKDGHGYLLARDSVWFYPEHSLSLDRLKESLGKVRARQQLLLLDACRNSPEGSRGGDANVMTEGLGRDIVAAAKVRADREATTCLLAACKAGQRAQEWPAKKHGVFTHYLLEGLKGDAWRGEELEFEDLAAYTHREVKRWAERTLSSRDGQEPWYEKIGAPGRVLLGNRGETSSAQRAARVLCPQCGRRNEEGETFRCRMCGRDYLCERHWDEEKECCAECAPSVREFGARAGTATAPPEVSPVAQGATEAEGGSGIRGLVLPGGEVIRVLVLGGHRYIGETKFGRPHGQGFCFYADGGRYKGEWKENKRHGQGTYFYPDGERYEGEWKDGKRHGQGTYYYSDGDRYEGEFKDGLEHGQGTCIYADGNRYEGEWKDGKPHGRGTYFYPDGTSYEGEWQDGELQHR